MQHLDIQVLNLAASWAEKETVWLCTVLSTFGSSPRPPGAMMAIRADGRFAGSLSGGCIEENFVARIAQGEFSQHSQQVRYGDGGLQPDRALPCGGVLDILVERLSARAESALVLRQMAKAVAGGTALRKVVNLPDVSQPLTPCDYSSSTTAEYDANVIRLTLAAAPRLIVAGLSVVAVFCANFAASLGFETLVCENREEALRNFAADLDAQVQLIERFPALFLEQEGCHARTAVVCLTHDPRMDDLTLMEAVHTDAFYIGAMGSARNSERRLARLRDLAELSTDQLERIHAPIGMAIASKTPAEIALSVMADIVRHKNHAGRPVAIEITPAPFVPEPDLPDYKTAARQAAG